MLATNHGLYFYDPPAACRRKPSSTPKATKPGHRLNDGKCDRRGRFWVGSMLDQKREPAGTLYRFDPDHRCHAMLDGFVLPNALSWSPDDRSMYFADTHNQVIWVFDYDLDDGAISNRRVFATGPISPAVPMAPRWTPTAMYGTAWSPPASWCAWRRTAAWTA